MLRRPATPLALAVSIVLLLLGGGAGAAALRHENDPRDAVLDYLRALAAGDVDRAITHLQPEDVSDRTLIRASALPASARLRAPRVTEVVRDGDSADVEATYKVGGTTERVALVLRRAERTGLRAPDWIITNALARLTVRHATGGESAVVNGTTLALPGGHATHPVLPGRYTASAKASAVYDTAEDSGNAGTSELELALYPDIRPQALVAAKKAAEAATRACLSKATTVYEPCQVATGEQHAKGFVYDRVHWSVVRFPKLVAEADELTGRVEVFSPYPGVTAVSVRVSAPTINPGFSTTVTETFPFGVFGYVTFAGSKPVWHIDAAATAALRKASRTPTLRT